MKLYPWHSDDFQAQRPAQWGDLVGTLFQDSMANHEGAHIEIDGQQLSFFGALEQVTRTIERRAANVNLQPIPDPTVVLPRRIFDQIVAAGFGVPIDILRNERTRP